MFKVFRKDLEIEVHLEGSFISGGILDDKPSFFPVRSDILWGVELCAGGGRGGRDPMPRGALDIGGGKKRLPAPGADGGGFEYG